MQKRYRALRVIATIYKLLGIIIGILTILAILGACVGIFLGGAAIDNLGPRAGIPAAMNGAGVAVVVIIASVIYGGGLALTLYALGEFIYLFLAIEENTRATVIMLERKR